MSDKLTKPVKNYLVYVLFAGIIFLLDLLVVTLKFCGVSSQGEGNYVGIIAGIIIFLVYGMVRFFPFTMVDSKYGVYGILIHLICSLIIFLFLDSKSKLYLALSLIVLGIFVIGGIVYYRKLLYMIKKEGVNDYVMLELKTFKLFELNTMSLLVGSVFLFYMLALKPSIAVAVITGLGIALSIFGKIKRTIYNKKIMNIVWLLVLEIVCLVLSYALIIAYLFLSVPPEFVLVMVILLQIPGLIITIRVHQEMRRYMYKE